MKFGSLFTAMITPFTADLEIDYPQAKKIARHLAETGSEGIVVAGTTGESPSLTDGERSRLFIAVKEAVGDQIPLILGAGTNCTASTIAAVKDAEALEADGVMLVAPYYNKPSQEGLYEHFKHAAESSPLPVILYNIPGRTGCNLLPETVARLAEIPQIQAVKESSGSLDQVTAIRRMTPEDFLIYSGDDSLTLPLLSVGGHGVISVASHVAGESIAAMIQAYKRGETALAAKLHEELYPLFKGLFIAPNPAPVKYAMEQMGFDVNRLRLPMVGIGENEKEQLDSVLSIL